MPVLMDRITNPGTPARLKGFALRLVPPTHPKLTVSLLRELLSAGDAGLALEVVRTLAARDAGDARTLLAQIAADESRAPLLRAEAVVGLSASTSPEHHALLLKLADHGNTALRNEALRALRSSALTDDAKKALGDATRHHPESAPLMRALLDPASINAGRPAFEDTSAWMRRLDALPGKADADAGRRIFFHPRMAMCATCHRHGGRGNVVGPDLSLIVQQGDAEATLRSILEPSREVAPQFYPTLLALKDGSSFTGIMLRSWSKEVYRDITGRERTFEKADILQRTELKTSLMPPGLAGSLTDEELRDLLAFVRGGASQ